MRRLKTNPQLLTESVDTGVDLRAQLQSGVIIRLQTTSSLSFHLLTNQTHISNRGAQTFSACELL